MRFIPYFAALNAVAVAAPSIPPWNNHAVAPRQGYLALQATLHNEVTGVSTTGWLDTSSHRMFFGWGIFNDAREMDSKNNTKVMATSVELTKFDGLPDYIGCDVYRGDLMGNSEKIGRMDKFNRIVDLDGIAGAAVETDVDHWLTVCDMYLTQ